MAEAKKVELRVLVTRTLEGLGVLRKKPVNLNPGPVQPPAEKLVDPSSYQRNVLRIETVSPDEAVKQLDLEVAAKKDSNSLETFRAFKVFYATNHARIVSTYAGLREKQRDFSALDFVRGIYEGLQVVSRHGCDLDRKGFLSILSAPSGI